MADSSPPPWVTDRGETRQEFTATNPVQQRRALDHHRDCGLLLRGDLFGTDTLITQRSHPSDKGSSTIPVLAGLRCLYPHRHATMTTP